MRGNGLYRVVPLVVLVASLALSSCRVFDYEQREPWRALLLAALALLIVEWWAFHRRVTA